ncbi:trypsin-like peptidase domain-containing protein [Kribbella sp. NPDC050124]|uniref:VMAP-C domain-containing protein n=1 Tax=Kribbella sp. NPDC050124 TaxID=3364114 RepID=UPI0037B7DCAE
MDVQARLSELAQECRVRVGSDLENVPAGGGSGVWIAPGTVLTCAHVVPLGLDSKVDVQWNGVTLSGTVIDHVPNENLDDIWPFPDLAIVTVDDVVDHPCAWLSEASPGPELLAIGHADGLKEGLRKVAFRGTHSGVHEFGAGRYWQLKDNEIFEGMSGGPVLDLDRGAVCGVLTVSISQGADRGGYLVPIDGLRALNPARRAEVLGAHDRFHGADDRWTSLRTDLPGRRGLVPGALSVPEETQLLALLAELPGKNSTELLTLLDGCSSDGRMETRAPTALRDVAYALLDQRGDDSGPVIPVVRMVHQLVGSDPTLGIQRDLYDWATALAGRLGRGPELQALRKQEPRPGSAGGLISIEIVPGTARTDRYRLSVSVEHNRHGRYPMYQDKEPLLTIERVREVVTEQLRTAIDRLAGNAEVEFVVPIELFDEPFDELAPIRKWITLGQKFRMVLRDFDRQFDRSTYHDWHQRWQQWLRPSRGIRWITCEESLTPTQFSAELEQHPDIAGVLLARRPTSSPQTSAILRVALDSGVPIAVWRRDSCAEHDAFHEGDDCSGSRFQVAFDPAMRSEAVPDLPETIRQLRNKLAEGTTQPEDQDCLGIVLLWDDPARLNRPVAAVRQPPYDPPEIAI